MRARYNVLTGEQMLYVLTDKAETKNIEEVVRAQR